MATFPTSDRSLFRVMAGNSTIGWRDISAEVTDLTYSDVIPGGPGSASFVIYQDASSVGYNELKPGNDIIISYSGVTRWSGVILPRSVSYAAGSGYGKIPVQIEATGPLARAKRRKDYGQIFVDRDLAQWYTADRDDMCGGLYWVKSGWMKCVAPAGSTYAANSYVELWYWIGSGLIDQDVVSVSFEFTSSGALHWTLYDTTTSPSADATWTQLATDGGSTHAAKVTVSQACSANAQALALRVYYDDAVATALTADEWIKFRLLSVKGFSGTITVGSALQAILVTTGLASSWSSDTVS